MPNMPDTEPSRSQSQSIRGSTAEKTAAPERRAVAENQRPNDNPLDAMRGASGTVLRFIQEHPVVAAGGALAAGAAIAMIVHSRRAQASRLDRRLMRNARQMERSIAHEFRKLRNSDLADRASRLTNSLGDALSRVDFNALSDRGQAYLASLRSRLMR